jgi:hypothetical protein
MFWRIAFRMVTGFVVSILIFIVFSCTTQTNTNVSHGNSALVSQMSTPIPTVHRSLANKSQSQSELNSAKAIRNIDFRNFTFPWNPCASKRSIANDTVTLTGGRLEIDEDERKGGCVFTLSLATVLYGTLTNNAQEDAVIYLAGTMPTNSFFGNLMIYSLRGEEAQLVWQHPTGDRGDGGLRTFRIENNILVVEEYDPAVSDVESLCCPKVFRRSFFEWREKRMQRVKSEVLPNEYSNAYVILPPTQQ